MTELIHQFSQWYLAALDAGGYGLIAALMALESTVVPLPSEVIIPPAAFLAQSQGHLSLTGIVLAGTAGSWFGAAIMYWGARLLGRPLVLRFGPYLGLGVTKIEMSERWAAHYGWAGVFFARLLPVIRHLIGIPAGIVQMPFRWYSLATLGGALLWTAVLTWLGAAVGANPQLVSGSLHRFSLLVFALAAVLAILYYAFVHRAAGRKM